MLAVLEERGTVPSGNEFGPLAHVDAETEELWGLLGGRG